MIHCQSLDIMKGGGGGGGGGGGNCCTSINGYNNNMQTNTELNVCSPFLRQSGCRASMSYGTLKQPKLPGAERFRFTRSSEDLCKMTATDVPSPVLAEKRFRRSTRYPTIDGKYPLSSTTVLPRSEHRRKPIIPISKQTSRVLNNTNAELSADAIEFIRCETANLNGICRNYVRAGAADVNVDCVPIRNEVEADRLCGRESWKPSFTTFLGPKRTEMKSGNTNNSAPSNKKNSTDDEWKHLRKRTGSSGSPSPTLSLCSNDSTNNDVWVLRQDTAPN